MRTSFYEPVYKTLLRAFFIKPLRKAAFSCFWSALKFFFLFQYRAALVNSVPVSRVDHPLDEKIPFNPRWVIIYLDFVSYWIRLVGFILAYYGKKGIRRAAALTRSIEELYIFAFQIYRKNLSTTNRPSYFKRLRFFMIHLLDPHLMCIPSLHVMIAIRGYTQFRKTLDGMKPPDAPERGAVFLEQEKERALRRALDITQAVLYVKQHSVNCIPAAMYVMSYFDPVFFPPEEAEKFAGALFSMGGISPGGAEVPGEAIPAIKAYISGLYRSFMEKGLRSVDWTKPLLDFLAACPRVN